MGPRVVVVRVAVRVAVRVVVVRVRVETSMGKVATFPIQITSWSWDLNQ